MSTPHAPRHCDPRAFALFTEQLQRLDAADALCQAATAVAMHELHEVDPVIVDRQLQELADAVLARVHRADRRTLIAHTHDILFEQMQFVGNTDDYYNPINSYLPMVLETRRGIPITLALIYREVLRRTGMTVHGINAPGHFFVAVEEREDGELMYVDTFHGGRMLTVDEAFAMIESVTGAPVPRIGEMLSIATPRQWLARLIRNLQGAFGRTGNAQGLGAMDEMSQLLEAA